MRPSDRIDSLTGDAPGHGTAATVHGPAVVHPHTRERTGKGARTAPRPTITFIDQATHVDATAVAISSARYQGPRRKAKSSVARVRLVVRPKQRPGYWPVDLDLQ